MNNTDTLVTFAATTRATRFWTGIDAAGHVAQFWTKQPDPADYPALAIAAHVIMPLNGAGDPAGWDPVGAAPALPAAAPVPESQPADEREAWEYSFIHSSATGRGDEEIGPCLTYDKAQAFGVGCIKQRAVRVGATLSAPAAAPVLPAGWREFIENIATPFSEPVNSMVGYRGLASRQEFMRDLRERARQLIAAIPAAVPVAAGVETQEETDELRTAIQALYEGCEKGAAPFAVNYALDQLTEDGVQLQVDAHYIRNIFAAAGYFSSPAVSTDNKQEGQ